MKHILYFTFYFEPDLCAGSFRNTSLAEALAREGGSDHVQVTVITTCPNRYASFAQKAPTTEVRDNLKIFRIDLPAHRSGMADQARSFWHYYRGARRLVRDMPADMVFASSSRLFTAFLGRVVAAQKKVPLYLDIRDIFVDTMQDVLQSRWYHRSLTSALRLVERYTFRHAQQINLISGGFKPYFTSWQGPKYSEYSNGIDDIFLNAPSEDLLSKPGTPRTILYAGNFGQGQGLHRIIPGVAAKLGSQYRLVCIGDGGAKSLLEDAVREADVTNVHILDPVSRQELMNAYRDADMLFIHLNDFPAFRKVLPSKIFELATFPKPLIAGVSGYAADFMRREVPGSYVFPPCDAEAMVEAIHRAEREPVPDRNNFLARYRRDTINQEMARSILAWL